MASHMGAWNIGANELLLKRLLLFCNLVYLIDGQDLYIIKDSKTGVM
jgi:hypothetical protein